MTKKKAAKSDDDTYDMTPELGQMAESNALMALVHGKQDQLLISTVPNQTKPDATGPQQTVLDQSPAAPIPPAAKAKGKAKPAPPKAKAPWEDANPKIPVGFNLRMDQQLHAKATWLCAHLPAMSQQKLYRMAVEEKIAQLLAEHWKPEPAAKE